MHSCPTILIRIKQTQSTGLKRKSTALLEQGKPEKKSRRKLGETQRQLSFCIKKKF